MDKKIEDYLPFYLGCEVWVIMSDGSSGVTILTYYHLKYPNIDPCPKEIKPLLRQLSDISEEEKREFQIVCELEKEDLDCLKEYNDRFFDGEGRSYGTAHLTNILQWAKGVQYLLSLFIDLFGLIDAGIALDKTKQ